MATTQVTFPSHPVSPPRSAGDCDSNGGSPSAVQSLVMLHAGQRPSQAPPTPAMINTSGLDNSGLDNSGLGWNPSRIFELDHHPPFIVLHF